MKRSPILLLSVPLLAAALVFLVKLWLGGHALPMRDFVEYYAAGEAFRHNRNPYDPKLLLEIQRAILNDPKVEQPIMMWNPPPALMLVGPLGFLSPPVAHIVWLLVQVMCVVASTWMLLQVFGEPGALVTGGCEPRESSLRSLTLLARQAIIAVLIASPVMLLLWYGQIGGLLLLGLAGHLYFIQRGRYLTAGAFAALTALKPHFLFAFGLALLLDAFTPRGRRVLLGGVIALSTAAVAAWLWNPMVYAYYIDSITAPSSDLHMSVRDWAQPNLSSWLRLTFAPETFRVQFIPTIIASIAIFVVWFRTRSIEWPRWLPWLVFVSAIFTAYGSWLFDLVVLVVPIVHAAVTLRRAVVVPVLYVLLNLGTSFAPLLAVSLWQQGVGLQIFIYYAPAMLVLYWLVFRSRKKRSDD